jgi:hypothetical protein
MIQISIGSLERKAVTRNDVSLAGKHVLIVEDELLIALLIVDMLADEGCTILGPCRSRNAGGGWTRALP